ncbi:MAG: LacI family DNA-binding transcriptional regulator [Spirochaetales bacterium]|nr:LacI family DNA-binding transcriptional regulator [Spirochaetales bacterium]
MSTLKDVASLAGVSPATASLALNGKPVNEDTRRLVMDCAKQLNYVANKIGKTLITGKSNTILLLLLNSTKYANLVVDTTFFYYYIEGVLEAAGERGYSLVFDVRNWEDADLDDYFYAKVHDKSVDGIIIIPQFTRPYPFIDVLGDFPYVVLNSHLSDVRTASFNVDNHLGGKVIAEYMGRCGFKDIAFINGPAEHYDAMERRRGFFDVIENSDSTVKAIIEGHGDWTIRSGYEAAETIFKKKKVEAIFCGNDFMASGVLRYLSENGYRVPDDVSIIGYDNIGLSRAIYPRLSTVDGYLSEIGKGLGNLLFAKIGKENDFENPVLKPRLVIRESSKPIK